MLANRKRLLTDANLVGRIDSEHLSEQFQRELSNSPGDDFLQDDLKLHDISNASGLCRAVSCFAQPRCQYVRNVNATGSGVAALAQIPQPQQLTRPDMLASMDVSDDNWYKSRACIHLDIFAYCNHITCCNLEELFLSRLACALEICVGL